MELWQLDIVGGIQLADGGEAKVVTGVDDHSRFCVIATVVRTATGRAVCLAFVEALQRFGIPDEVLSDNGKQFTGRFNQPRSAEVMFERICRENGIVARHTKPRSPTTTGKVERFHQTLERELLDDVEVWPDVAAVQAAVDAFRIEYNTNRPHQSLEMAFPADRFTPDLPISGCHCGYRRLLAEGARPAGPPPIPSGEAGDPIEVDRLVNGTGLISLAGRQHPIGYHFAGRRLTVRLDHGLLQLVQDGMLLRSLPNPLTPSELARIRDARPAGPPPQPAAEPVQVERRVSSRGAITIEGQRIHIGIIHAGRTLTVESADHTFRIYDGDQLLAETGRTTTKPIARFKVRKPEPPRQRHPAQGSAIWH